METVHTNKRLWSKSEAGQAEMMCLLSMMAGARREVGNCFGGRGLGHYVGLPLGLLR
jgi:hypothetical protein